MRIGARLGARDSRVLLDSGIGVSIVTRAVAEAAGGEPLGTTFSAGLRYDAPVVGVLDLGRPDVDQGFEGILGLDLFAESCVTVDPGAGTVTWDCSAPAGTTVPVSVERDGPSVVMFAPLELPSGRVVRVEVDTGSAALILDESLMGECDVTPDSPGIETRGGTDETGHEFVRRCVTIPGSVRIPGWT